MGQPDTRFCDFYYQLFSVCSVQCTVYSVQGMVYSVQCTSFLFVPLLCFGDCTEVYLCMAEQSPGDIGPRSIYMGITSFYGGIMFLGNYK